MAVFVVLTNDLPFLERHGSSKFTACKTFNVCTGTTSEHVPVAFFPSYTIGSRNVYDEELLLLFGKFRYCET